MQPRIAAAVASPTLPRTSTARPFIVSPAVRFNHLAGTPGWIPDGTPRNPAVDTISVSTTTLQRKLGRAAWEVWQRRLQGRDDHTLENWYRVETLLDWPSRMPLSWNSYRRAVTRLTDAGLTVNLGWHDRLLPPEEDRKAPREYQPTHVVLVYGTGTTVRDRTRVPAKTAKWLLTASAHGGSRPGAGRPRKMAEKIKVRSNSKASSGSCCSGLSFGKARSSSAPALSNSSIVHDGTECRFGTMIGNDPRHGGFGCLDEANRSRAVPSFPGQDIVPEPMVPPPPRLPDDADDATLATILVAAYRDAVKNRYHRPCWAFFRGDLAKSKHYPLLVTAGRKLRDEGIPPIAWAAWAADTWKAYGKDAKPKRRKMPPPAQWVYSAKLLAEHLDWFWSESGTYLGKRGAMGPVQRELGARWMAMHAAILTTSPAGGVAEIVARFFPDDTYDRLVEEAREESAIIQERLRQDIRRGKWVWL